MRKEHANERDDDGRMTLLAGNEFQRHGAPCLSPSNTHM